MFIDAGTFSYKHRSYNVTETSTCISENIVYGIICRLCNIIYIGETGCRLADKMTEHIRSIPKNSGFPVAQHFNPPSHCSLIFFLLLELSTVIVQM